MKDGDEEEAEEEEEEEEDEKEEEEEEQEEEEEKANLESILEIDASRTGLTAVLSQRQEDNSFAYAS